jgi:PQQ-dependent dehydrogenase (s-GDH family)
MSIVRRKSPMMIVGFDKIARLIKGAPVSNSMNCSLPALAIAALFTSFSASAQIAPGPGINPRTVWSEPPENFRMRVIASELADPWEVTYGPDGYLWVTERVGKRVLRIDPDNGTRQVVAEIEEVTQSLGQDGLLGLVLHPDFSRGSDFVYVMYTYDADPGPDEARRAKLRRYRFDEASAMLRDPVDILTDLPHGPDHGASRMAFGPDGKIYASRGDHGGNFLGRYCQPILSQQLPTQADIAAGNWRDYQGKILRINQDGSIPEDNPVLNGVRSHVFSYGHRNPQGMAFGPDGVLYSAEHGQDTDDEVNRIVAGGNYGWPEIAGFKDDQYYTYANWSASSPTPCEELRFGGVPPDSVPKIRETDVDMPDFVPPLKTFFTVPSTHDARASGNATAALTGLDVYTASGIPGWNPSLLVASLVSGTIYRLPLDALDQPPLTYFKAADRYRDLAISPDGLRIYVVTTSSGRTLTKTGEMTPELEHRGALLEFTYTGTNR